MELGAGGLLRELGFNVNRHQKCRRHTMTQEIDSVPGICKECLKYLYIQSDILVTCHTICQLPVTGVTVLKVITLQIIWYRFHY